MTKVNGKGCQRKAHALKKINKMRWTVERWHFESLEEEIPT